MLYNAWGRDSEEKTVRKSIIVICAVLVLALVAGCSADSIMRTGKAMGKLGDASFGGVGVKLADDAAKSVDDFTEKLEALLSFDGVSRTGEGADEKIEGVVMLNGGGFSDKFSALMKDVVDKILAAKNSSASDAKIRAALDTLYKDYDGVKKKYTGKTIGWSGHKAMKELINCSALPANLISMVPGFDVTKLYAYDVPFPFHESDILALISRAGTIAMTNMSFVKKLMEGGGGQSKFNISQLKYIPESISSYVGKRMDPTVGDKLAFYIIYDLVDTTARVLKKYSQAYPGDYDHLTADWLFKNCVSELDRAMADLSAIGYIYDFGVDVSGIAASLI